MITKESAFGMYIGQKSTKGIICGIDNKGIFTSHSNTVDTYYLYDDCKLILRPLEDMTEEERKKIFRLDGHRENIPRNYMNAEQLEYLISIGIDIFNLKERGWAVYERDIK